MSTILERVKGGEAESTAVSSFMEGLVNTGYNQSDIATFDKHLSTEYGEFNSLARNMIKSDAVFNNNAISALDMTFANNIGNEAYERMLENANEKIKKEFGQDAKTLNYAPIAGLERGMDINACKCYTITNLVVDLVCADDSIMNYLLRVPTVCKEAKFTRLIKQFVATYQTIGTQGINVAGNVTARCEEIKLKQLFYYLDIPRNDILCSCALDHIIEGVKYLRQLMAYSKVQKGVFYGDGAGDNPIGMDTVADIVAPGVDLIDTIVKMITRLSAVETGSNAEIIIALNKATRTSLGLSRDADGSFILPQNCNPKLACVTFVETCQIPNTGVGTNTITTDIFGFIRNHYAYADGYTENYSVDKKFDGANEVQYGAIQYFYSQPINDDSIVKSTVSLNV